MALLLAGCVTDGSTGLFGGSGQSASSAATVEKADTLAKGGDPAGALAILGEAIRTSPNDRNLKSAYGRILVSNGHAEEGLPILQAAYDKDHPDWRNLNAQGAALDQLGRMDQAQAHYQQALALQPNEASVLTNLGLSYALSKKLDKAEEAMRLAAAQPGATPKIRQNLAFVLTLRGKYAEAKETVAADLGEQKAAASVNYWKKNYASAKG
jgi:Flp pilus assembly protein TadD